jgi:hypothetical protein
MKRKNEGESGMEKKQDKKQAPDKQPWTLPLFPLKRDDKMMMIYDPDALGVKDTFFDTDERLGILKSRIQQSMAAASDVAEKLEKQSGFRPDALDFEFTRLGYSDFRNRKDGHIVAPGHEDYGDRYGPRFIVPDMGLEFEKDRIIAGPFLRAGQLRANPPYEYKGYNPDKDVLLLSYPESFAIFRDGKVGRLVFKHNKEEILNPKLNIWDTDAAKKAGLLTLLAEGKCERALVPRKDERMTVSNDMVYDDKGWFLDKTERAATVSAEIYYTIPRKKALAIQRKAGKQILEFHPLFKRALFAEKLYKMDDYLAFKDVHTTREMLGFISSKYKT